MKSFKLFLTVALGTTLLFSCKKEAGSGGTSSITGHVMGTITSNSGGNPEAEVTTVTCTGGILIDDNDYWLLNSPNGNLYYIWYDNDNWVGGDPALSGRTGIKVDYTFSHSNTMIATNTMAALQASTGSDFTVTLLGDIVTITCNNFGSVADAEDINSPMAIDVQSQGSGGSSGPVTGVDGPMVEERVYLVYGDEAFYSESVRTDAEGFYQFKGLNKGKYHIYAFSMDTTNANGFDIQVGADAEITKKQQVVDAGTLYVVK